jgi:hypothetical protein
MGLEKARNRAGFITAPLKKRMEKARWRKSALPSMESNSPRPPPAAQNATMRRCWRSSIVAWLQSLSWAAAALRGWIGLTQSEKPLTFSPCLWRA